MVQKKEFVVANQGTAFRVHPTTRAITPVQPYCTEDIITQDMLVRNAKGEMVPIEWDPSIWKHLPVELRDTILEYVGWHYIRTREYHRATRYCTITKRQTHLFWKKMRGAPQWENRIVPPTPVTKACMVARYMFLLSYTYDQLYQDNIIAPDNSDPDPESDEAWFSHLMVPWLTIGHPYRNYTVPIDPLRLPAYRRHTMSLSAAVEGVETDSIHLSDFENTKPLLGWAGRRICDAMLIDGVQAKGTITSERGVHPVMLIEIKNGNGNARTEWVRQRKAWECFVGMLRLGTPDLVVYIKAEFHIRPGRLEFLRVEPPTGWHM